MLRITNDESRTTKAGFSLLEVLLAILLLSVGLVFLLQTVNAGLLAGNYNKNEIIAANLAQEKIEWIRNTTFASISPSTESPVTNFPAFNRVVTTQNDTPVPSTTKITVTVSWYAQNTQTNLTMVSYVSDI